MSNLRILYPSANSCHYTPEMYFREVWISAIKPISGNFLKLDGVGQVIPTKAYSKKV
jgi:hypothetical protein